MRFATRSVLFRYGSAVLAVAAALLIRLLLAPLLHDYAPYATFLVAVAVVGWYADFGPSLLTSLLGYVAVQLFFKPPPWDYRLGVSLLGRPLTLSLFPFVGLVIALCSGAIHVAKRRAETSAREAHQRRIELEREVAERKRLQDELQLRAEELAEAGRRKDEFLAMLGHELRNPLAPIRSAAQLLKLEGDGDARSQQAVEVIDRQVRHLARLVDDLLDVSRISRGQVKLRKEPVELAEVVRRAVEVSRPLIAARGHAFAESTPREPLWLVGDPVRLAQILTNLLNNAAKYTEPGGHIRLTAEKNDSCILWRVRDDGIGVAPELLPRLFHLFTQADRSLDRSQGGLGIGLALVKSLVEMHGGSVAAFSEGLGRGSEFVVRLPILTAKPAALPSSASEEKNEESPQRQTAGLRRVLVVDDNRDAAESLAMVLRWEGHETQTAYNGPAALQAAAVFRPEIVFLDIGLPGMDGYAVARQLRQDPASAGVLLVALTGYGQDEDRRRSREAGFDHHLVKPVEPDSLQELLAGAQTAISRPASRRR
ncbi:MAG TPA: ATP-binding protein [Gemmataceae bacterium]|nr:ATP-binding protein [Gemmataceae bacterium]